MMNWKSILAAGAVCAGYCLSQTPSMHPRANMHDYAVQSKVEGGMLAASVLSPAEVRSTFTIDLAGKGYTVVEVAFYPENKLKVSPDDFVLRLWGDKTAEMRPVRPSVLARALGKTSAPQTPSITPPVQVSSTSTVGYESYPTYDQNGRPRQAGGVVMASSVGVGMGAGQNTPNAPSRISDNDRETLQAELANRSLPEDTISQPTAGFLYFRNSTKKKDAVYELQYAPMSDAGPVTPVKLVMPKASGK